MKARKWIGWSRIGTILLCGVILLSMGCCGTQKELPPLREQAVPNINPEPRPAPPLFNDEEFAGMSLTARGKVAKYQAGVDAYADIMEGKIKILKDYIRNLFTPEAKTADAPAAPAKKSWWPWGRGGGAPDHPTQ